MQRLYLRRPQPTSVSSRLPTAALMCAVALLLGVAMAWAQSSNRTPQDAFGAGSADANHDSTRAQAPRQFREGTEITGQPGHFRMTGDRVTFFAAEDAGRFVVLENLNLQRIARTLTDRPDRLKWDVTGTVTEFCGSNYLFVRRAVLRSRVQSPDDNL